MKSDDVYRFVALRQPAPVPPGDLHDPFIAAYGNQGQPAAGSFRQKIADALGNGELATSRQESLALLQNAGGPDAWALIKDTVFHRLFLVLPGIARSGNIDDVEKVMMKVFDVSSLEGIAARGSEIAEERGKVADYFAACALSGWDAGDFDGAAHLICCFETLERILAVSNEGRPPSSRRAAWQVPLNHGVVVLPFELPRRPAPGVTEEAAGPITPTSFIGDLIVLKQQLRRYELGEIAHVANVLAKEKLDQVHRTLRRTESKLLTVEDTEKEISRDLQTTTRDELSSEIQKAMSEQLDLSVNFNVTATYMGPGITVTGSVGGAAGYRRSSEERTATATAHSQEVVSRASERVRERTLTQREKIETAETEQTATHGFNNDTDKHIVGVYRWLERCFDLHLVNYGRRLIYEFVVPEPSSYWSELVSARGHGKSGPPPVFPQVAAPATATGPTTRALALSDFSLSDAAQVPLERPERWAEIVSLAGAWGVTLEPIPPPTLQVHFALTAPGETNPSSTKAAAPVGGDTGNYYESGAIGTVSSTQPLKIPSGYRATEGYAAMKGWRYLRASGSTYFAFERGEAHLQLNGRDYAFLTQGDYFKVPSPPPVPTPPTMHLLPDGRAQVTFTSVLLIAPNEFIEGEVPVVLTTTFNGLTCSIRLECKRTEKHAAAWSERMFSLFAAAYAERLARYEDDSARALLGNDDWAGALPSQTARAIEQRELKRGVLTIITENGLAAVGAKALGQSSVPTEPEPHVPEIKLTALRDYERIVRFFEMAFDWNNLAYLFSPYFYGRRKEWTRLAVADNADAQFKAFLSAGAARVQVPVRPGYEAHVTYYFSGLGLPSFEQRVPWLSSMRPIAEDLAATAREGFDVGPGRISVAANSDIVTGVGTLFRDPEDIDREIRLGGQIYVIREVRSATDAKLSIPYQGSALDKVAYEVGGIVVGPTFPLKLATTLVAIDTPGLTLPIFAGRYAE